MTTTDQRAGTAVAVPEPGTIEAADPETASVMVTKALEESKAWLSTAMQATDPTPIAEFKAWAATVEEAARQKKLGREIELDAAEMVGRAERGLGVAVRRQQESGHVAKRGANRHTLGAPDESTYPVHSSDLFSGNRERADSYALTDGVDDEQFDEAVAAAKDEGNLSRANLVRKTRAQQQTDTADRWEKVASLATSGHTSDQIAAKVDLAEATVRRGAKQRGIPIPADEVVGRVRRLDSDHVVDQTVHTLAGVAIGLDTLIDYTALDPARLDEWAESVTTSLRRLNRFARELKHARRQAKEITEDQEMGTTAP